MNANLIAGAAACVAAIALAGCQPASTPANSGSAAAPTPAPAAAEPSGTPATPAAAQAGALSGDAVRDLARLTESELAFDSPLKDQFLTRYFGGKSNQDKLEDCGHTESFSQDTFDEVCRWSPTETQEMPTLLLAMNIVRPSPNIWSAAVVGDAYGAQPLGPVWECGTAADQFQNVRVPVTICTLKSMSSDRPEAVKQWARFFKAAN